jgi:hypothetical protein
MTYTRRAIFQLLFIAVAAGDTAHAAVNGTPEQALLDIVTTSKPEVVEDHLPVVTADAIRHLATPDRQAAEKTILIGVKLREQGLEPRSVEDGSALVEFWRKGAEGDSLDMSVKIAREIVSGGDALLELSVDGTHHGSQKVLAWMRLEEGEWRISELQRGDYYDGIVLDTPAFVEQFRGSREKESEGPALATLRSINTALVTYAAIFPDIGFPSDLAALASTEEGGDPTPERAGLLSADFAVQPYVSAGYVFLYQLLAGGRGGSYSIVARPAAPGPSGSVRFYTDESGVIRSTPEDRDPTADDEPVE